MAISFIQLQVFILIFARILGLFMEAPIFSEKMFSRNVKNAFMFFFAFLLWFVVPFSGEQLPPNVPLFIIAFLNEFMVGFIIGFIAKIVFAGVEAAGEIMGAQMGLSVSSMLDPTTGSQTSLPTKLLRWVVIIVFFIVDGHHFMLVALERSFRMLPLMNSWNIQPAAEQIVFLGVNIFAIGVQLAAPIILTIFLIDFAFGLISRVAPQVNVFMLGFQLKPPVGVFIFLLTIPLLVERVIWIVSLIVEKYLNVMFYFKM